MENDINNKLNPILEILGLLYMSNNFDAVKTDMQKSLEDMGIEGEYFYKQHLSYLESYVGDFKAASVFDEKDMFFFEYSTEFFLTAAAMAAELFVPGADKALLDEPRIFSAFKKLLTDEPSDTNDTYTLEESFALLQSCQYCEDTKWRLLELLHNPVEKFQKLFSILENNKAAYSYTHKKNKKLLAKLVNDIPEKLSEPMHTIIAHFHSGCPKIYLTAALPLIEWLTPTLVFKGVLTDKLDIFQNDLKNAKENLPQVLKLLGDKSKFEILCLLKAHGRYNLEIAESLHLTPATASHHMSMLLSSHMVTVEKKNGKVYYQLNQSSLKNIVEAFERILL